MQTTKKTISSFFVTLLCLVMSVAVFLIGVYAKELSGLSKSNSQKNEVMTRKTVDSDTGLLKIQHDPHSHVERQTSKSIVKMFVDNTQMNADARNLRKVRHVKRVQHRKLALRFTFTLPFVATN